MSLISGQVACRAKPPGRCQVAAPKIFHFTEIRKYRMRRPSQSTEGAVVRRHERGQGVAVDAGGVEGGCSVQGEMNLVSMVRTVIDERRSCVRRNRVVLAVVATVKPRRRRHARQPARCRAFRGGEGGQKELGSRESAA
jgi:hypothetical protein